MNENKLICIHRHTWQNRCCATHRVIEVVREELLRHLQDRLLEEAVGPEDVHNMNAPREVALRHKETFHA